VLKPSVLAEGLRSLLDAGQGAGWNGRVDEWKKPWIVEWGGGILQSRGDLKFCQGALTLSQQSRDPFPLKV
jgi:hypothetical protein